MKKILVLIMLLTVALMISSCADFSVTGQGTTAPTQTIKTASDCPDDGQTNVTVNVQNTERKTSAETFDAEITFVGDDGSKIRGTDTTDGTYNLNCGATYEFIVESADGDSGDNSKIVEVKEGIGAKLNEAAGTVTFTPERSSYNLRVGVPQHGVLEFKAYDNDDARFAYNTSQNSNSVYFGDGVTFRDGNNATAFALTNVGDYLDMTFKVRTVQIDTEFCDNYCLIAVEAPVTEYDEPTVRFEGTVLNDIKAGGLNPSESKQLSNYEYVYKYEGEITHLASEMDFYIEANANPSTDIQVDFVAAGKVDSINGVDIIVGTAQDNSAATTVYAVQDVTIDVS